MDSLFEFLLYKWRFFIFRLLEWIDQSRFYSSEGNWKFRNIIVGNEYLFSIGLFLKLSKFYGT